jgi:hypothetical protein
MEKMQVTHPTDAQVSQAVSSLQLPRTEFLTHFSSLPRVLHTHPIQLGFIIVITSGNQ